MKLFVLALLAFPLAAAPLYTLYDCAGQESACNALFPGSAAPREDYVVGGRVVVDGVDLGPARGIPPGEPTFAAFYHRSPWVIGWQYCCDWDEDGHVVRWLIEDSVATLFEYPELGAGRPGFSDVNSKGQFVGTEHGSGLGLFYDTEPLRNALGQADIPAYLTYEDYPTQMTWTPIEMLRINNDGQALFTAGSPFWLPRETRSFVLSPFGVPGPKAQPSDRPSGAPVNTPEPGTWALVGVALITVGILGRGRSSRTPATRADPPRTSSTTPPGLPSAEIQ